MKKKLAIALVALAGAATAAHAAAPGVIHTLLASCPLPCC